MARRIQRRYSNAATKRQNVTAQEHFARIPKVNMQRSSFDRSSGVKTAIFSGFLNPIFVDEALPGDTFTMKASIFGRLTTPIQPVMENLYLDWFFFSVPNRLVWDNWQKFNGEQANPGDSTDFLIPTITSAAGFGESQIFDFMGVPTKIAGLEVSALHLRAYNLIYNEWFRDENLQDSVPIHLDDGPDPEADYEILRRGKRHDYFTSCLPWPQKGAAVEVPLGDQAPLLGVAGGIEAQGTGIPTFDMDEGAIGSHLHGEPASDDVQWSNRPTGGDPAHWNEPNLQIDFGQAHTAYADLSQATAVTINALREAFQIQRMYEKDARGGTRYTEVIRSHFGVTSPDSRLQRPEYMGGGTTIVNINPVAQTSASLDGESVQGNLAAFGTTFGQPVNFTQSFTEHCVIIGLCSLRADLNYQQGLEKMWSRRTRFDFFWPSFAHLGEQAVLNKEIYAQGTPDDDDVFGYQERYAEYRYKPSRISGGMRSNATATLDSWHLSQDFENLPVLNSEFIVEDPPMERILAVTFESHLLLDAHFALRCSRPMPTYSVPGMIDHF